MKIEPLNDRVLLRRLDTESASPGGILIPDTAKEKPMRGEVVAVGPGERAKGGGRRPMGVSKGDIVVFGKYAGTEVRVEGEDLVLVREDEIFAVVE